MGLRSRLRLRRRGERLRDRDRRLDLRSLRLRLRLRERLVLAICASDAARVAQLNRLCLQESLQTIQRTGVSCRNSEFRTFAAYRDADALLSPIDGSV